MKSFLFAAAALVIGSGIAHAAPSSQDDDTCKQYGTKTMVQPIKPDVPIIIKLPHVWDIVYHSDNLIVELSEGDDVKVTLDSHRKGDPIATLHTYNGCDDTTVQFPVEGK